MPKSKFPLPLPIFHQSAERFTKGVNTVLPPKLDPLDIEAILDRANKVNGREYNISYIEKIITEMYPRLANIASPTPQKAPNPSPLQPKSETVAKTAPQIAAQAAPEVAPPPIISNAYAPETAKAPEQLQNLVQAPKPVSQTNQELPQNMPDFTNEENKQAYVEAARAAVLRSYAEGEEKTNSTQAFNKQAQGYVNSDAEGQQAANDPKSYRLAA